MEQEKEKVVETFDPTEGQMEGTVFPPDEFPDPEDKHEEDGVDND